MTDRLPAPVNGVEQYLAAILQTLQEILAELRAQTETRPVPPGRKR